MHNVIIGAATAFHAVRDAALARARDAASTFWYKLLTVLALAFMLAAPHCHIEVVAIIVSLHSDISRVDNISLLVCPKLTVNLL